LGYIDNQRIILFGYLLHLLVQGHQGLVFSGVFIAEDVDGVGDKESGYTTLGGLFNMSLRSVCFAD